MAEDLKNKILVITGGATGIGYQLADQFLQKDAKSIVLLDINEKQGVVAAQTLSAKYGCNKAVFLKCDVTKDIDVADKVINTYKNIDILINNAGVLSERHIKKTIQINVQAVIEWSMKFWDHMRKDKNGKGGTIINLASRYGYKIDQFLPIYQASKFAVMGFTKSLGHLYNYERSGVRVMAICPGFTKTQMTEKAETWDDEIMEDFDIFVKNQEWQNVDSVGKAAVEVFEEADSGTAWLIEGARPIREV